MKTVNTSIRIPKEIIDKLRDRAKEQDRSLNYVINEFIRLGLHVQE